jgi:hypothetical protein
VIHYHGTPIGGSRQDTARFLVGRHALIPHARRDDLGVVAEVCKSFVFDNSAFTEWKNGRPMDAPGYTRWCDEWHRHPGFAWALIPDIIDGSEADNDALIADWPRHIPGVPVWHLHESLDRLCHLAHEWPRVALGSSGAWRTPGSATWWARMTEAMHVVCDAFGRPVTKLHGLRMLNPKVFSRLPLASADSVNAGMNSGATKRFGVYVPATAAQRAAVIADRIESHNAASVWVRPLENLL